MGARIQVVEILAKEKGTADDDMQDILAHCGAITAEIQRTIVVFQFYDKLTQRISHVSNSLGSFGELINDSSHSFNPIEWSLLQENSKSKYAMAAEHHTFEIVSREERAAETGVAAETSDNIEFF